MQNQLNSIPLTVVGIARVSEDTVAAATASGGGIGYRRGLTSKLLNTVMQSEIVRDQISKKPDPGADTEEGRKGTNIFSGAPFSPEAKDVRDLIAEIRQQDAQIPPVGKSQILDLQHSTSLFHTQN